MSGATSWEVPNAVDDWDQHLDEASGSPYWHNRVTRVMSWEDPSAMGGHEWVQHIYEESGVQYWHHPLTGDINITWDDPAQLPGHVSNKTVSVRRKSLIVVLGEDRDKKVIELMSTTETTFVNLIPIAMLKNKVNRVAEEVLVEGSINAPELKSFQLATEQETSAKNLDEVFVEAGAAMEPFTTYMRGVTEALGKNPDSIPLVDGEMIVDEGHTYKTYPGALLKEKTRAAAKVDEKFDGNHKCLIDW